MNKFGSLLLKLYRNIATAFLFAILMWLIYLAVCNTCYMPADITEVTYFVRDSVWKNLTWGIAFICVLSLLKRVKVVTKACLRLETDEKLFLLCKRILTLLVLGLALLWVLTTQFIPTDDQSCIVQAVIGLRNSDYGMFSKTGYISINPNQIGLVFLCYLFSFLFGSDNYVMFQVFNAIGLTISYIMMSEIAEKIGVKRFGQLVVYGLGMLFCPLLLYCSFVYGNVLGLAFSLVAIRYEVSFFEYQKKRDAIISAVAIMCAIMIKNNYLIAMVAMLIYALVEIIKKPKGIYLLLPVLVIVFFAIQAKIPVVILEQKTGYDLSQGESPWSYVAMGLQGTGWFNAYNVESYIASGYDTSVQAEMAKGAAKESLLGFFAHKREAVSFFTKKVASEWNNPTFQGFWIVQVLESRVLLSKFTNWFIGVGGMNQMSLFLDIFQLLVLVGTLLYCIMGYKQEQYDNALLFVILFIGGFLFHIVWEAKCQYTITYFVLLFPLAVKGYGLITDCICNRKEKETKTESVCLRSAMPAGILFGLIVTAFFVLYGNGHGAYLGKDTTIYSSYAKANGSGKVLEEGTYRFYTKDGSELVAYSPDGAAIWLIPRKEGRPEETILWVKNEYTDSVGAFNYAKAGTDQPWVIKIIDEDTVCILYKRIRSHSLTYDSANLGVGLEKYTGASNQLWGFEKVE